MSQSQYEKRQGNKVFIEVLPAIKKYIDDRVAQGQGVPLFYEVLLDVEHCNMALVDFLKIMKVIAPVGEFQFNNRLYELLRVTQTKHSGGEIA